MNLYQNTCYTFVYPPLNNSLNGYFWISIVENIDWLQMGESVRYDPHFDNVFEDLRLDIRGSIAHEYYEISDDGKKVIFKRCSKPKKEYSLIELARINSYQAMMLNFIMAIHDQIELEFLESEKVKIQKSMRITPEY